MNETVTLHHMISHDGSRVQYARLVRRCGRSTLTQSVLLSRLTPAQRIVAKDAGPSEWRRWV